MLTILLEVKSNDPQRRTNNFYNPAPTEYRRFPRTENGIGKAIEELSKLAHCTDWIQEWRFVVYNGKYHYSKKEMHPMFIIDNHGQRVGA